jgi:uncharacterized RDD family membrane protein YckC
MYTWGDYGSERWIVAGEGSGGSGDGGGAGLEAAMPDRSIPPPLPELDDPAPVPEAAEAAWGDRRPHPWRRLLARYIDVCVAGIFIRFCAGIALQLLGPSPAGRAIVQGAAELGRYGIGVAFVRLCLLLLFALPVGAVQLGSTGTTLGKWIFGIRVVRSDGCPIGIRAAFDRELRVLVRGLALGVPFANLVTGCLSYGALAAEGATPWDKALGLVVLQRPNGRRQTLLGLAAVLAIGVIQWQIRRHG